VVVLTGHDAERILTAIAGRDIRRAHTAGAFRGMSASLGAGLAALDDSVDAAIVCLGDMPWIAAHHLDALIDAFVAHPERRICVPVHEGRRGNPVLWPKRHFSSLRALEGDVGGRALLARHGDDVLQVPIADDGVVRDVDTPDDLPMD
jgi:molybdenum cofactor cytidylyltransferase